MSMPPAALQQFEARKADPRVQVLTSFIRLRLGIPLKQVGAWTIDITHKDATFHLEFLAGCQIEGTIDRREQSVFKEIEPRYRWIVAEWTVHYDPVA